MNSEYTPENDILDKISNFISGYHIINAAKILRIFCILDLFASIILIIIGLCLASGSNYFEGIIYLILGGGCLFSIPICIALANISEAAQRYISNQSEEE